MNLHIQLSSFIVYGANENRRAENCLLDIYSWERRNVIIFRNRTLKWMKCQKCIDDFINFTSKTIFNKILYAKVILNFYVWQRQKYHHIYISCEAHFNNLCKCLYLQRKALNTIHFISKLAELTCLVFPKRTFGSMHPCRLYLL